MEEPLVRIIKPAQGAGYFIEFNDGVSKASWAVTAQELDALADLLDRWREGAVVHTINGFIVTKAMWYTTMGGQCIGIITGHTAEGKVKRYIGMGAGYDEEADARLIAETGAKFYDGGNT